MADLIGTIILSGTLIYLLGLFFAMLVAVVMESSSWKYAKFEYIFGYPILLYYFPRDLIVSFNNYLNKNKLKQMNFKILGKAMGFMFLPTLGVLLMLLVGFFDPIAMWNFIKSTGFWAVFIRVILFIAEIGLVVFMYFYYLEEESNKEIKASAKSDGTRRKVSYSCYARDMFEEADSNSSFTITHTVNPNIVILEHSPKSK